MVQDIFKSLWERRAELVMNNAEHYLIRAAKFKTFEYFRNKAIQQKVGERTMQVCPYASNCTEERVLYNELCSKVNRAVDDLPCQCRRVYKMSREHGMRNKDIARELMISERAVELHISKALSSLRLKLADL
ncbi:RNA polymerase sigma-70 factor, ECF subfamily [Niabella drilacis]|uniref:RNA polymerase sigma-70 factor, ECF subfamily n=2 Tax=Niabella drilacis (strain DSM 25811 / CCM 8410 / CCUG 62505 / LMG 26954 / E90) TaxID=1285928 RepID=A0A1G6XES4_NIADE|nr:RNA polymerase sigma-70 factor, ECF subfamily [Niabella drilacis]